MRPDLNSCLSQPLLHLPDRYSAHPFVSIWRQRTTSERSGCLTPSICVRFFFRIYPPFLFPPPSLAGAERVSLHTLVQLSGVVSGPPSGQYGSMHQGLLPIDTRPDRSQPPILPRCVARSSQDALGHLACRWRDRCHGADQSRKVSPNLEPGKEGRGRRQTSLTLRSVCSVSLFLGRTRWRFTQSAAASPRTTRRRSRVGRSA